MKKCFFWGATGQSLVLKEFIEDFGFEVNWFFDNNPDIAKSVYGVPVLGGWDYFLKWAKENSNKDISFLVSIGGNKGKERLGLQEDITKMGFNPLTVWHKTAFIARGAGIGIGSQILANASICAGAKIGKACIINTGGQVDHECVIGDGVHIMPGAVLAGCVYVGNFVTIGSGAVILPRIKIGEGTVIGAGAVVVNDVGPYTVAVGTPAKFLKKADKNYVFKRR